MLCDMTGTKIYGYSSLVYKMDGEEMVEKSSYMGTLVGRKDCRDYEVLLGGVLNVFKIDVNPTTKDPECKDDW